jgi:hypothetical protein
VSEKEHYLRQVERITASTALHASQSLCKLLRYLATHSVEQPQTALGEYQIATEALGRPSDFDPQLDSTVRVQVGRLRLKLAEYYRSEGAEDEIIVELPKGMHTLCFSHRSRLTAKSHAGGTHGVAGDDSTSARSSRKWMAATIVLAALFAGSLVVMALNANHGTKGAATEASDFVPNAFQVFWKPFFTSPEEPLVVYSNAMFVGRPETGLRYFNPALDSRDRIFDQYTGVGEVIAVHDLDRLFGLFHRQIFVKRGQLFTLDDAENDDLIFVGSPSENLTLQEIPNTKEFVFERLTTGPRKGDLAIVNVHPNPGEATDFLASPATAPFTEDYAIVALMPGINPARSVLILAGTTTFGTQGAVEYICSESSLKELLLRLSVSPSGEVRPFEALLHVKVTHGVPVEEKLVAVRERPS